MKKFLSIITAAAAALAMTGCSGDENSSSEVSSSQSANPESSSGGASSTSSSAESAEIEFYSRVRNAAVVYYLSGAAPVNGLPEVKGFGKISDLSAACAADTSGSLTALVNLFKNEASLKKRFDYAEQILHALCKTEDVSDSSSPYNAKNLKIAELFWNTGEVFAPPQSKQASDLLNEDVKILSQRYCFAMIASEINSLTSLISVKKDDDGKNYPDLNSFSGALLNGLKQGTLGEKTLRDAAYFLVYYGAIGQRSHRCAAEFYAYAQKSFPEYCETIKEAYKEANEVFKGLNGVDILFSRGEIEGGRSGEVLVGSDGDDTFTPGAGSDFMLGGEGADVYVLKKGCGNDMIYDFSKGNVLRFEGVSLSEVKVVNFSERDVKITFADDSTDSIILRDFRAGSNSYTLEAGGKKIELSDAQSPFRLVV